MWGTHDGFLPLVKVVWNAHVDGCPMFRFSMELKALKSAMRKWNIELFGRVEVELRDLENCMWNWKILFQLIILLRLKVIY